MTTICDSIADPINRAYCETLVAQCDEKQTKCTTSNPEGGKCIYKNTIRFHDGKTEDALTKYCPAQAKFWALKNPFPVGTHDMRINFQMMGDLKQRQTLRSGSFSDSIELGNVCAISLSASYLIDDKTAFQSYGVREMFLVDVQIEGKGDVCQNIMREGKTLRQANKDNPDNALMDLLKTSENLKKLQEKNPDDLRRTDYKKVKTYNDVVREAGEKNISQSALESKILSLLHKTPNDPVLLQEKGSVARQALDELTR